MAAGIGEGEDSSGNNITITGGTIIAIGNEKDSENYLGALSGVTPDFGTNRTWYKWRTDTILTSPTGDYTQSSINAYTNDSSFLAIEFAVADPIATATTAATSPDSYLVTFLDCQGNTVKIEWVPYQRNATPPTGYGTYSGYSDVSSHMDLYPTDCGVTTISGYTVPNTGANECTEE